MKITLFLLLFVIFQVYSGNCYSQNARVSIQNARLRVGQVLEQIESQTEYLFYITNRTSMYAVPSTSMQATKLFPKYLTKCSKGQTSSM